MSDLNELMNRIEELDPELKMYMFEEGRLGVCIKHPLVYSMMYAPAMNAMLNHSLRTKREAVTKAFKEGAWETYIWMHERPWRFSRLVGIHKRIADDNRYWELFASVYTDSENVWQNRREINRLMKARPYNRASVEAMMDEDEIKVLDALPETVRIYRGYTQRGASRGLSWTLDRDRAQWFAKRLYIKGPKPKVMTAETPRSNVFAYFDGRGEKEILVRDPKAVTFINRMIVS